MPAPPLPSWQGENLKETVMYTLQIDAHGNSIVCKGAVPRSGYRIVRHGTYNECLRAKLGA